MHTAAPRDHLAEEMRSNYKLAISAKSHELAARRTQAGGYQNSGHRMYVEGVLEQRRRAQLVPLPPPSSVLTCPRAHCH